MAMLGFNSSLEIGRKALRASELALEITGHNIANVNTPGYTRQVVEMKASEAYLTAFGSFGSGVQIDTVRSIRDQFIDFQIVEQASKLGGAESRLAVLDEVETVFDESMGYGLTNAMTDFFNSFLELAARPEDLDLRTNVVGQAEQLIDSFQSRYYDLINIQERANEQVRALTDEANVLTGRIAELNEVIAPYSDNNEINDLVDERRNLIDRLSELVNINTWETEEGFINVSFADGGAPLVAGADSFDLAVTQNPLNRNYYDVAVVAGGTAIDVTSAVSDGNLGGYLDMRDNVLPDYLEKLDTMAYGFISNVNTLHTSGFDYNGNAGQNFFNPFVPGAPGDYEGVINSFSMNAAIVSDPRLIAASATGSVGDNQIAQQIVDLSTALNVVDADHDGVDDFGPFSSYYNSLLNSIGTKTNENQEIYENQRVILVELENKRDSVSGVNLDEEASFMMQYQHSYQAAARYFNTVNSLLDILVNQLGR